MKNMKISVFYAMVIATTIYCPERPKFDFPKRPFDCLQNPTSSIWRKKPFDRPQKPISDYPNATPPQQSDQTPTKESDAPKNSIFEIIGNACTVLRLGKEVYSWLPNEANERELAKNKSELEEYNVALAKQREIDKAKRAFNQCCRDNNGLNVDRMATGLARTCQEVAMSFAALGYREEIEDTIEFYNKFRE